MHYATVANGAHLVCAPPDVDEGPAQQLDITAFRSDLQKTLQPGINERIRLH